MCGVCGLVSLNGAPVDAEVLAAMNETLFHRGPDSGGAYIDGNVGIAARRLAIIDLAGGDQPIANEDRTVHVVQNGEIYNYRELRRDLEGRGHRFSSHSDTEVLVHLYEEDGPRFVERLRGMFAIAVWDSRHRRLVLGRDRFGIKPLYYRVANGRLSFGSELKALLRQPDFSREIDLNALDAFLTFGFVPAPMTIFVESRKLLPGHVLVWDGNDRGVVTIDQFAQPAAAAADAIRSGDEQTLAEELRERLRDSVRAHLIADVPVGVLLSGGVDSSALTALAAEESSGPVSTFTIGFDERHFDERGPARLIAQRYGTDHHELVLRPDAAELLPDLIEVYDEPFSDGSAIPTYLVSQLARQHVKVALSGEGGDELFGGYNYYVGHRLAPAIGWASSIMRPFAESLPTSMAKSSTFDHRAKRFTRSARLPTLERHYMWKTIIPPEDRDELVLPECRPSHDALHLLSTRFAASQGVDDLARVMDLDIGIFLVDDMLVKTDRASMAHSLEARVPVLDTVVAELALSLPSRMKVRGFSKKRLLKRAVEPLVPAAIIKGEKRGFAMPLAAWLRGELRPLVREVLSPRNLHRQGFFHPEAVQRLIKEHWAGRADHHRKIWAVLTFSLWYERYAAEAPPTYSAISTSALDR
jgi:asparagine synthase (glutamine-hydrolysing)